MFQNVLTEKLLPVVRDSITRDGTRLVGFISDSNRAVFIVDACKAAAVCMWYNRFGYISDNY